MELLLQIGEDSAKLFLAQKSKRNQTANFTKESIDLDVLPYLKKEYALQESIVLLQLISVVQNKLYYFY